MDKHCIYSNPNITAPCFPFVQLDEVEEQKERDRRMTIIKYHVQPFFPQLGGDYLYSVLHQRPSVENIWQRCRQTFRFDGYDAKSAIGNWGKVFLVASRWPPIATTTTYSTIQYVNQTEIDCSKVSELERLTKLDAIPWDAKDEDEASDMVSEAMERSGDDVFSLAG